jgi:hypothetical protein
LRLLPDGHISVVRGVADEKDVEISEEKVESAGVEAHKVSEDRGKRWQREKHDWMGVYYNLICRLMLSRVALDEVGYKECVQL